MTGSLASVHPELIPEWSEKNLPLTPDKITFGSNKRVWWKGACGHEWETSVKARSKGEKCPICSGARVIEGINDLATLKPLLAQEWSKKNKLKPTEVSVASHKKIIWKCKHGHEWEASVKSRTVNGTGCPYCSHNKVLAGFNDLASQYPDIAAEWSDRNLPLLPTMVTAFANSKAWWKCKDCGNEWYTLISTRSGGSRCPYCTQTVSYIERYYKNGTVPYESFETVVQLLKGGGVGVDHIPYTIENLMFDLSRKDSVERTLFAYEMLVGENAGNEKVCWEQVRAIVSMYEKEEFEFPFEINEQYKMI